MLNVFQRQTHPQPVLLNDQLNCEDRVCPMMQYPERLYLRCLARKHSGRGSMPDYVAMKGAIVAFTQSLDKDLVTKGIVSGDLTVCW